MSVAINIVSQFSRSSFIRLLYECITENVREYENIKEINIIDGTQKIELQDTFRDLLFGYASNFVEISKRLRYYNTKHLKNRNIGALRNYANKCVSDNISYIIWMDDDDYQFKTRVKKTVEIFEKNKNIHLVGCNTFLFYDYNSDLLFRWMIKNPNSVPNCTLSTSLKYARRYKYDENKKTGEEETFLNKKYKIIEMNPLDCIVQIGYNEGNTYNKNKIVMSNLINPTTLMDTHIKFFNLIGMDNFEKYNLILNNLYNTNKKILELNKNYYYDITYMTGVNSIEWDPESDDLGGSEQAIVELCKRFIKKNKSVEVYGNFKFNYKEVDGVIYKNSLLFDIKKKYNTLILWRKFAYLLLNNQKINLHYNKLIIDLHDIDLIDANSPISSQLCICLNEKKINNVFYKSEFHKIPIEKQIKPELSKNLLKKSIVIPNGVHNSYFNNNLLDDDINRDDYKFIYCSCYTRGLPEIINFIFNRIKKVIPSAKLVICYGMDNIQDDKYKKYIVECINRTNKQHGQCITEMGRLPREEVKKLKKSCGFHLYPTLTSAETDCISIKESLLMGCVPVLVNCNVFKERDGLKFEPVDINENNNDYKFMINEIGKKIAEWFKNNNKNDIKKLREKLFLENKKIKSWDEVADMWLNYL